MEQVGSTPNRHYPSADPDGGVIGLSTTMTEDPQLSKLPPRHLRPGGARSSDELWVQRGIADARLLTKRAGLATSSRLLDWGCGPGRLLVGISRVVGPIQKYTGLDVKADVVDWATANLATPWSTFVHVDQHNARYNARGDMSHSLPFASDSFDIACAFSVFTHMRTADAPGYSAEITRLLRPGGLAVLTAFVEPDVPDDVENPVGYLPELPFAGPLHCVRYERDYFEVLLRRAGLDVVQFIHRDPGRAGQSVMIAESAVR